MAQNKSLLKSWWLYVLELEQGKYYIGITTTTPEKRFRQHMNGYTAARWTRKYKPVKIFYAKNLGYGTEENAKHFENVTTSRYMDKYGFKNVRGGNLTYDGKYYRFLWFNRYLEDEHFTVFMYAIFFILATTVMLLAYILK